MCGLVWALAISSFGNGEINVLSLSFLGRKRYIDPKTISKKMVKSKSSVKIFSLKIFLNCRKIFGKRGVVSFSILF